MTNHQHLAVLTIDHLPTEYRSAVEALLVATLVSPPALARPGTDPFGSEWFTAWRASPGRRTRCRQVLDAKPDEFAALRAGLEQLQTESGCEASLEPLGPAYSSYAPSPKGSRMASASSPTESTTMVGR